MASNTLSKKPSIYEPLEIESYEIRMLTLLPGPPGSVVRCRLEKTFLINPTKYAALSYCWGDSKITAKIIVNDVDYPVTVNLMEALQQLRSLRVTRVWADALCINQSDEEEKGHQIRYMKHIYSRAEETYAWMGNDKSGTSDAAVFFLQVILLERTKLSPIPHSHPPLPPDHKPMIAENTTPHSRPLPNGCQRCLFESDFQALISFFNREYWKRRWIIQEIAAASRVHILCGSERIALNDMNAAISRCRTSCYWKPEVETAYYHLERVLLFRKYYQESKRPGLCEAIRKSQNSLSSDDRDKIFALLGICKDGTELVPDELGYQYPVEVIVMTITKSLIQKTGCLDLILFNAMNGRSEAHEILPDWTPNWLSHDLPKDAYHLAEKPFRPESILAPDELPVDSRILRVQGVVLGTILDIASTFQLDLRTRLQLFSRDGMSQEIDAPLVSKPIAPCYYHDEGETIATLVDCLVGHGLRDTSAPLAIVLYALSTAWGLYGASYEKNSNEARIQKALRKWTYAHADMPMEGETLKYWFTVGMIWRSWICIGSSTFLLSVLHISMWVFYIGACILLTGILVITAPKSDPGSGWYFWLAYFWAFIVLMGPLAVVITAKACSDTGYMAESQLASLKNHLVDVFDSPKRLVVSDRGFIATTSAAAIYDDIMCFLVGCSNAVIMRKTKPDSDSPPQYRVVGTIDVYLNHEDREKYKGFHFGERHQQTNHALLKEYREEGLLRTFDLT
ncbi:heterokaryon incompatibility protein-domain-containing protein [Tricladium varicosporioides]|nr:heterokaryon incompatibility protein-domain-containing protein [Hymenoscyphus varicosporioides]